MPDIHYYALAEGLKMAFMRHGTWSRVTDEKAPRWSSASTGGSAGQTRSETPITLAKSLKAQYLLDDLHFLPEILGRLRPILPKREAARFALIMRAGFQTVGKLRGATVGTGRGNGTTGTGWTSRTSGTQPQILFIL